MKSPRASINFLKIDRISGALNSEATTVSGRRRWGARWIESWSLLLICDKAGLEYWDCSFGEIGGHEFPLGLRSGLSSEMVLTVGCAQASGFAGSK